jgi:hypothetical protein
MTTSTHGAHAPLSAQDGDWKAVLDELDEVAMSDAGWDWPKTARRFSERARTVAGLDRELIDFALSLLREKLPRKNFAQVLHTLYPGSSGDEFAPLERAQ